MVVMMTVLWPERGSLAALNFSETQYRCRL